MEIKTNLADRVYDDGLKREFLIISKNRIEDVRTHMSLDLKKTSLLALLSGADQERRAPDSFVFIGDPLG